MKQKWMKKSLSLLLTAALTVTLVPAVPDGVQTIKAAENAEAPGLNAYATTDNLMNSYDVDGEGEDTVGKLIFGKSIGWGFPQEWYILGSESLYGPGAPSGDNTVLFAADSMGERTYFDTLDTYFTTYKYENETKEKYVCVTHYGASNLRQELKKMETSTDYFSTNEQTLMNTTTISCHDSYNEYGYQLQDKLYLPEAAGKTANPGDSYVYAGRGSSYDTANKKKIALSYWTENFDAKEGIDNGFWLRTALYIEDDGSFVVGPYDNRSLCGSPKGTIPRIVTMKSGISPAVNINLTNVAFASSVPTQAITSSKVENISSLAMRLRMKGSDATVGKVRYDSDTILATKSDSAKKACLVVQGKAEGKDWYYKKGVAGSTVVSLADINGAIANANFDNNIKLTSLDNCKIWLETTDDTGATYANAATYSESEINIESVNYIHLTVDSPIAGAEFDKNLNSVSNGIVVKDVSYMKEDKVITDSKASWYTIYTIAVTVSPDLLSESGLSYVFEDDTKASVNGQDATITFNTDGTATVKYTFSPTEKRTVIKVDTPKAPTTFANAYTAQTVLTSNKELPTQTKITFDDGATEMMNIVWKLTGSYTPDSGAVNSFCWELDKTAANYDACDFLSANVAQNGTVEIANAEKTATPPENNNGNESGNTSGNESGNKPGNTTEPPKANTVLTDEKNQATYVVTQSGSAAGSSAGAKNGEATYFAPVNKNSTHVVIPDTVTIGGIKYKITSISKNAFKNNKKITKVTIGKNVKTIGSNAFSGCNRLKTVVFGKNVTTIGSKAFYNCKKLKSITLNGKLKTIGDKAFYKCTSLTRINIPGKVNKIGKQAFYGCKKLKNITINTKKLTGKNVGSKAFRGIHSKATIKVPKAKKSAYKKLLKSRGIGSKVIVK